jgi:hypothetical protein
MCRIKKRGLYLPEQHHCIVPVDEPVVVEIKHTDRLIHRNPLHLGEHEHNVVEVLEVVGVQVFIKETVPIWTCWWIGDVPVSGII